MADATDIRKAVSYLYRLKGRAAPYGEAMDGYVLCLTDMEWPWIQEACRRATKTRTVPPDGSQLRTLCEIVRFETARHVPPKHVHESHCKTCDDSGWAYLWPDGRIADVTTAVVERLHKVERCVCWYTNPVLQWRRQRADALHAQREER